MLWFNQTDSGASHRTDLISISVIDYQAKFEILDSKNILTVDKFHLNYWSQYLLLFIIYHLSQFLFYHLSQCPNIDLILIFIKIFSLIAI